MDPFTLLNLGGAAVGGLSALFGGNERQRVEEEYNRKAYGGLMNDRDRIAAQSPEATRRAALQQLSTQRSASVANSLNQAAGATAQAGGTVIGGNVQRGADVAALAAEAPYAQTAAGIEGQRYQMEAGKNEQLVGTDRAIADLSNHVSYLNSQKQNPLLDTLKGITAGVTAAGQVGTMMDQRDVRVNAPVSGQVQEPVPGIIGADKVRRKVDEDWTALFGQQMNTMMPQFPFGV